jgi:hypothetical protein
MIFILYGFCCWAENWVAPFACHTQVKFKEEKIERSLKGFRMMRRTELPFHI